MFSCLVGHKTRLESGPQGLGLCTPLGMGGDFRPDAIRTPHLVSSGCYPVELGGRVGVCPALQRQWLPRTNIDGRREGIRRDLRETAVCPGSTSRGPVPSSCHHLPQLSANQLTGRGAEGGGRLQDLEMGLVAKVGPPGGAAVASERV